MISLPPTRPMLVTALVRRYVCGVPSAICQINVGIFDVSSMLVLISPRPHWAQKTMPSRLTVRQLAQIMLDSSQGLVAARERGVGVEGLPGQGARVVLDSAQANH